MLNRNLTGFYTMMTSGLIAASLLAHIYSIAWNAMAFLCFTVIITVFLIEKISVWKR